jgi:hypothetical protein
MLEEYYQKLAEEMARTSLTARQYPFEICDTCEPNVLELLTNIHLEELLSKISDARSAEPTIERLNLHRWLARHRAENGHGATSRGEAAAE